MFDEGSFLGFLVGQFWAPALRELIDRFLALLQDCLQELNRLVFVEFAEFFHFFQLNRSLNHAQDAELEVVPGFHGDDNVRLNFFRKTHFFSPGQL